MGKDTERVGEQETERI